MNKQIDLDRIDEVLKNNSGYSLSKKLGVSETSISRWRKDPSNMVLKNALALDMIAEEQATYSINQEIKEIEIKLNKEWVAFGEKESIRLYYNSFYNTENTNRNFLFKVIQTIISDYNDKVDNGEYINLNHLIEDKGKLVTFEEQLKEIYYCLESTIDFEGIVSEPLEEKMRELGNLLDEVEQIGSNIIEHEVHYNNNFVKYFESALGVHFVEENNKHCIATIRINEKLINLEDLNFAISFDGVNYVINPKYFIKDIEEIEE